MGRKKNKKGKKMSKAQKWDNQQQKFVGITPTTEEKKADFRLIIPRQVMDKISWWMHKTDKEVSGFGSLDFDEKTNTFMVKDAILLKQKVSGASAEIDPHAMGKAMFRMKDDPNGLKWHWHSHVNMGVFWSPDDMEIIRSLGQRGWILASVFNYKNERKTAYYTTTTLDSPVGKVNHDVFIDDIPTTVTNYVDSELYQAWDKEYNENVSEYVWRSTAKDEKEETKTTDITPYQRREAEERERRAATSATDGILPIYNYDEYGYGIAKGWKTPSIYNPCFDKSLRTEAERLAMIEELDPEEIEFLEKHSPLFMKLFNEFILMNATTVSEGTKTEGNTGSASDYNKMTEFEREYYHGDY